MKNFVKHNILYLLLYAVLLVYVGSMLLHEGKVQIHREMNAVVGNKLVDSFFDYITHLGDGAFAFLVAIIFLFFNIRKDRKSVV